MKLNYLHSTISGNMNADWSGEKEKHERAIIWRGNVLSEFTALAGDYEYERLKKPRVVW